MSVNYLHHFWHFWLRTCSSVDPLQILGCEPEENKHYEYAEYAESVYK